MSLPLLPLRNMNMTDERPGSRLFQLQGGSDRLDGLIRTIDHRAGHGVTASLLDCA